MGLKHDLKRFLRDAYARVVWHTGLHVAIDALMPRRLTILAGHCVVAPSNAKLPKDMRIGGAELERILTKLARRYDVTSVGDAWKRLHERGSRSLVALSMDDGYADNRTHLLPLLQRVGVSATVYLESAPLDERRVNWSHKLAWLVETLGAEAFVERFAAECRDERTRALYRELVAGRRADGYQLKRVLKYEAPAAERNRAIDAVFAASGGDERGLCDELYLRWDDARALLAAGVELGGHTVHHEILARLDENGARAEVTECKRALERGLATTTTSFAYPFGRRWDWNEGSKSAVRDAGFATATTTHAGVNGKGSDPYELKRVMIDEDAALHRIATEACGGFELLRKIGIDLGE